MKKTEPHKESILVREGLAFVIGPGLFALLFFYLGWNFLGSFALLLTAGCAFFFRNPRRYPPLTSRVVTSPADGKILSVGEPVEDPRLSGQKSRCITIFLSVFNVHVNRYPCDGKIQETKYNPGRFFAAYREKASLDNEQTASLLSTPEGNKVLIVQIAGWIARRIVCYAKPGVDVSKGEFMGLIRFGSRVDLWLPAEWEITARPGQMVKGGESVLALRETGLS